jgi:hypothetical protein
MITSLHAVAADPQLSIQATIDALPRFVKRLMAEANVGLAGKRISVAEIDRQLNASGRLSAQDRIALKLSLERAKLLEA